MKKRGASEAELPLAERARRAMMALVADLGEVVALFDDAAAGRTGPLPLASTLSATAFELLGRANAVVQPHLVAPIGQTWLPDDILRYIFEFALGRRRMSQFGAGGRATNPPMKLVELETARAARVRPIRLVCRKWSAIASMCVTTIKPASRHRFDAAYFVRLFPNVVSIDQGKKYEAGPLADVEQLVKLYMARENKPLFVQLSFMSPLANVHGAYCSGRQNCGSVAKHNAKFPFSVTIGNTNTLTPVGTVCRCNSNLGRALTSGMPIVIARSCSTFYVMDPPAALFNVPSLTLDTELLCMPLLMTPITELRRWENAQYPLFVIAERYDEPVNRRAILRTFCDIVGVDRVQIEHSRSIMTAADYFG